MPVPMMNIINGGAHADNPIDFQEFMIQPSGFKSFRRSIQCGVEIFHTLKDILKKKKLSISVGDEGGFSPKLNSSEQVLDLIMEAIDLSGYKPEEEVFICIDSAATEFFQDGQYSLNGSQKNYNSTELIDYLCKIRKKYPISSIEDGLAEDDWESWKALTNRLGKTTQLVGDDLFVTNVERLKKGIEEEIANAILIKMNQIGTISETLEAIRLSKNNNFKTIISHRSGETEDTTIADLAVAVGAGQIKTGAPSRTDRVAKYNRLLIIEQKNDFKYFGNDELQ